MQRGRSNLAVTLLHVSDTQFGAYHRFSADDSLAGHLIRDVAGLIGGHGVPRPDLIVLSGDITERARADEFGQARAFLDALCAELELGPERVLGDAGFGKSFLVRQLARLLLGNDRAGLTPIVVFLRDRDKRQSLEDMVAAELVPSGAAFQIDRFRHSLEAGTLALLIDGYDEFAVRVGYANAAAQLRTFTEGLRGRAKIALTTRPSHFRSADEVTTKLFDLVGAFQGKVFQLEPFDEAQQLGFLIRWFERQQAPDPIKLADRWMNALARVDNLPELARTPRMLSFMVADLKLTEIEDAAGHGTVTAADLYRRLLDRWLKTETDKIGPHAPSVLDPGKRRELLEELALGLWRTGNLTSPRTRCSRSQGIFSTCRALG